MKNKFFLSLNAKIFLILFLSFAGICTLFLSTFMMSYAEQMERESVLNRKKAESLFEMYEENLNLREALTNLYPLKSREIGANENTISELRSSQEAILSKLKPQDDRYFAIRRELLQDIRGAKERDQKFRLFGYFILSAFVLIFFILEILWLIVRRWVLKPIEILLDATHHISSGDLDFRIPVTPKLSKQDELDLLARDFNKMAANIESSIREIDENRKFLQNLIDGIPDGICVLDENYNIILTNLSYEKMYPYIRMAPGMKCYELFGLQCPCRPDQNPCPLDILRQNPHKPVNVIQRYTDDENRERFMEVSAAGLYYPINGKEVLRIIELIRPLDKAILFSHQQKLSAVGMLASSVAHEMRNPLGSVRLILENILDKMDKKPMAEEDLKRYLNLINEQISFCINVTSRLLKLSRKSDNERHRVDLNEVVSETACLLEYEAKKAGIEIVVEESDVPPVISAADAEMRMLTVNLMQNAFHAMPDGGKMTISIKVSDSAVHVYFADTGYGIPAENLQRIFEPFFSQHKDNETTGTGLGLSIVKTIVENFKGQISVASKTGEGTVFHLSFDLAEDE